MKKIVILAVLISITSVYSSEKIVLFNSSSYPGNIPTNNPAIQKLIYSNSSLFSDNIGITGGTSLLRYQRSQKPALSFILKKHKQRFVFAGIGLVAGIISGIYNSAAKSQYDDEKYLYGVYINAPRNSNFNKLWNEYKKTADKTDRYLNLRSVFGTGAGLIGASLIISIIAEGEF